MAGIACGLGGCARMEAPPGGPEDKTRPFVSAAYPAPGAVNAPRELKARIGFSEWVAKDAERGKVWLSPPPEKRLKVEARGDVLEITSDSPLDPGTTYVLGVAGTIKDLVGLPLEAPFQLVFSTGPALDSGTVTGGLTAFSGAPLAPGTFAALYPEDPALRTRFSHLAPRLARTLPDTAAGADSETPPPRKVVPADSLPHPFREKPTYLAAADSLGRFRLEGVRPGRYRLLAFQDANQDALPDASIEPLALGPSIEVHAGDVEPRSLALAPLDTAANRLVKAAWVHESLRAGRSQGTLRLSFAHAVHPARALRRELYTVRRAGPAGSSGAVPVLDLCFNPDGELELYTAPLEPDSAYVVACGPVPDMQGNPLDTSRDEARFEARTVDSAAASAGAGAAAARDSARVPAAGAGGTPGAAAQAEALPDPVFLGQRRVAGTRAKAGQEQVFPSRGLSAYFPRILGDSLIAELGARLEVKSDTMPVRFTVEKVSHHEFRLRLGPVPLRGQTLKVGYKAPAGTPAPGGTKTPGGPGGQGPAAPQAPSGATPSKAVPAAAAPAAPAARISLPVADSARLGALKFRQDASARGAVLVLRSRVTDLEISRVTPAQDEFTVDSIPEGSYSAAYFRDADRDTLWSPGRLRPWTSQEDFVLFADSLQVKPGSASPAGGPSGRLAFPPAW